nr:carbon-nitrogen hydrolase family protein [uncultured Desulfobulbus sp.]
MASLKLGLLHLAIEHKEPEKNRQQLLAYCREAGERGLQIVAAPELCISGYSFASIEDMAPYAETADGPTLRGVAALCKVYSMYACIGLAERDERSSILYNSAFVIDPQGEIICRYRKINAEFRWACPGDPAQDNTFLTPWGRIGVLICSDCYHSLMPRITALRGANLILVVANWPPVGDLNPVEIWQARAMENGVFIAVCNRTGVDATMDCRNGYSALISPRGVLNMKKVARTSRIAKASIPLNKAGLLKGGQRLKQLTARNCAQMHACYLNRSGFGDISGLLQLPNAGQLQICCHCPGSEEGLLPIFETTETQCKATPILHVLAPGSYDEADLEGIRTWCATSDEKVVLLRETKRGDLLYRFDGKEQPQCCPWDATYGCQEAEFPFFDCGAARVHLIPGCALHHPEHFLAAAKKGADMAIVFNQKFNDKLCLLGGARTIEQLSVVLASPQGAGIWMTPQGHQRWQEILAGPGEHCSAVMDTRRTRLKRFQDRIDYHTLLLEPESQIHQTATQTLA